MPARGKIVALAGGVGAARFLDGLVRVTAPERLFIVGNVGDDAEVANLVELRCLCHEPGSSSMICVR